MHSGSSLDSWIFFSKSNEIRINKIRTIWTHRAVNLNATKPRLAWDRYGFPSDGGIQPTDGLRARLNCWYRFRFFVRIYFRRVLASTIFSGVNALERDLGFWIPSGLAFFFSSELRGWMLDRFFLFLVVQVHAQRLSISLMNPVNCDLKAGDCGPLIESWNGMQMKGGGVKSDFFYFNWEEICGRLNLCSNLFKIE